MLSESTRSGIVVGIDGSAVSDAAVRWAVSESATRKLPTTLIHVVAPTLMDSTMAPDGTIPESRLDQARQVMAHSRQIAAGSTDRQQPLVQAEMAYAGVASTLLEASKDAYMIVTGSRGVDAFDGYRLGSVSAALLQDARCSIGQCWSLTSGLRWCNQVDCDGQAAAGGVTGPDRAAHCIDESSRHRQSKADTAGDVWVAEPPEWFEHLLGSATRNARSLVDNVDQHTVTNSSGVDADWALGRIAQRVVDEVGQYPLEHPAVGDRDGVTDLDLDPLQPCVVQSRCSLADSDDRLVHHFLKVHATQLWVYRSCGQP
jgi:nucleotide-binding universal stress UspA family protein